MGRRAFPACHRPCGSGCTPPPPLAAALRDRDRAAHALGRYEVDGQPCCSSHLGQPRKLGASPSSSTSTAGRSARSRLQRDLPGRAQAARPADGWREPSWCSIMPTIAAGPLPADGRAAAAARRAATASADEAYRPSMSMWAKPSAQERSPRRSSRTGKPSARSWASASVHVDRVPQRHRQVGAR